MSAKAAFSVFERVEREVWIITAAHDGRLGGLAATFVNPASIVPTMPRIVVGLAKTHETWKLIEASGAFAAHLVDESQLELVWQFGLQSSRDSDKFNGLVTTTAATGSPILTESIAWLDCQVEERFDTGDRTLFLAEAVDAAVLRDDRPLSLQRLLKLAPPGRLELLRKQLAADAARDADEIERWRGAR